VLILLYVLRWHRAKQEKGVQHAANDNDVWSDELDIDVDGRMCQ
jgi:hypothetical protein